MDDVGQTLLNWASAFGTQEMVGHLKFEQNMGKNIKLKHDEFVHYN